MYRKTEFVYKKTEFERSLYKCETTNAKDVHKKNLFTSTLGGVDEEERCLKGRVVENVC